MKYILAATVLFILSCGCKPVNTKQSQLHGKSIDEIVKILGKPISEHRFIMGDHRGEFGVELYNHYPLSKTGNSNIEIKQLTWVQGENKLTLWLHLKDKVWKVLESCKYPKGAQF